MTHAAFVPLVVLARSPRPGSRAHPPTRGAGAVRGADREQRLVKGRADRSREINLLLVARLEDLNALAAAFDRSTA